MATSARPVNTEGAPTPAADPVRPDSPTAVTPASEGGSNQINRRRFLGYVIAAPTLVVAARFGLDATRAPEAGAVIPSLPGLPEYFDLGDLQVLAASPTAGLISIVMNSDGTASFAMPRARSDRASPPLSG